MGDGLPDDQRGRQRALASRKRAFRPRRRPSDLSVHRRVFQCPLVFESDFNGFACPSAWLDAPNPAAESVMARHAKRYLDMLIPDPADGSITERARRSHLPAAARRGARRSSRSATIWAFTRARCSGCSKRKGGRFAILLGDARRELALRYLSNSTHSVAAIAQMTGYAAPSSFTRWFCAEFGVAPAAWRAEERQAEA